MVIGEHNKKKKWNWKKLKRAILERVILKYATTCNHPQPPTAIHNHPQPSKINHNHPQPSTTTHSHLQPPTTTQKTTHNHPQPPKFYLKQPKLVTNSYITAF